MPSLSAKVDQPGESLFQFNAVLRCIVSDDPAVMAVEVAAIGGGFRIKENVKACDIAAAVVVPEINFHFNPSMLTSWPDCRG